MESEFPTNSHSRSDRPEKEEPKEKKLERVTTGQVVRQKKSLRKRFTETFVGGDTRGVGSYVILDILVPAMKDTITDVVSQGVERLVFGEARSSSRRTGMRPNNNYVSYNRYSSPVGSGIGRREEPRASLSRRSRAIHNFDEIILATRVEAEEVIDRMIDLVTRYESATVADLYELVGVTGDFTDEKYGWTDIPNAGVTRVRNGYLLNLPRPEPLD